MVFIIRKTYGWFKEVDKISNSQIVEFTGLTIPGIRKCIAKLESLGIVEVIRSPGGRNITEYRCLVRGKLSLPVNSDAPRGKLSSPLEVNSVDPQNLSKPTLTKPNSASHPDFKKTVEFFEQQMSKLDSKGRVQWYGGKYGKAIKEMLKGRDVHMVEARAFMYLERMKTDDFLKKRGFDPTTVLWAWNNLGQDVKEAEPYDKYTDPARIAKYRKFMQGRIAR